ncbi:MAG: hypothetical protein ACRC63_03305, partial [Metamycoplasmataceae bacterium]
MIIDNPNTNRAAQIELLGSDLKLLNDFGTIILKDYIGLINTRDLKNNQDAIIAGLQDSIIYKDKGVYSPTITYSKNDVVWATSQKLNRYYSADNNNTNNTPSPSSLYWKAYTVNSGVSIDAYTKSEIDNKFNDVKTINDNQDKEINTNKSKLLLEASRITDISENQKFVIDPLKSKDWEYGMVYASLDPSAPLKDKVQLVPSVIKEYQLKQALKTTFDDLQVVKEEIKEMNTSTNKTIVKQLFYGAERKDPTIVSDVFYGYNHLEYPNPIPLAKQVGNITFGNIFNVSFNEWNGVFYNGVQIPFGTNNSAVGINLTGSNFKANFNIENITLYKEVVNDGITTEDVNNIVSSFNIQKVLDYEKITVIPLAWNTGSTGSGMNLTLDKALGALDDWDIEFVMQEADGTNINRMRYPLKIISGQLTTFDLYATYGSNNNNQSYNRERSILTCSMRATSSYVMRLIKAGERGTGN